MSVCVTEVQLPGRSMLCGREGSSMCSRSVSKMLVLDMGVGVYDFGSTSW